MVITRDHPAVIDHIRCTPPAFDTIVNFNSFGSWGVAQKYFN